jgi:hypothetical protein
VTARILAQHRVLAISKNLDQVRSFGIPRRARPFELITKLLLRHPLHRLIHGSDGSSSGVNGDRSGQCDGQALHGATDAGIFDIHG